MNKFVKQQLMNCNVELPYWDDNTLSIYIQKRTYKNISCDKVYNIKIKNYILEEPSDFTLSIDWNKGTKPPEENMLVKFIDTKGKMKLVNGVGKTTGIMWEGWLPEKGFKVV